MVSHLHMSDVTLNVLCRNMKPCNFKGNKVHLEFDTFQELNSTCLIFTIRSAESEKCEISTYGTLFNYDKNYQFYFILFFIFFGYFESG